MKALFPDNGSVQMGEADAPEPAPDEALIGVAAYSVNRGETFLLDRPETGWRPGKDVAGIVLEPAADGAGPPTGTRVVGYAAAAGWAEQVAVKADALAVLPDSVEFTVAATLPLAGLTALRLLRAAGSVLGRRVMITGASGGVGHFVTELAVNSGAQLTAVCATHERGSRLRAFGADTVTDVERIRGWFDIGMESVGGASFSAMRRRVRPDGQLIWFGQAGLEPISVDFFDWVDGTVGAPIIAFDHARTDRSDAEDLATLVRLVAKGRLHPEIGSTSSWEHTGEIVADIRARRLLGNAVLHVTS